MGGEPLRRTGGSRPALDVERGRRSLGSPHASSRSFADCEVWAVLNVTPDSFSDGGRFRDASAAIEEGLRLARLGARVVDVGGESSRPPGKIYGAGAERVPVEEELARVVPVVAGLAGQGVRVSIDTVKPEVAREAIDAGAAIVNDVSCGASSLLLEVVASRGAELVLMHSRHGGRVDESTTAYGDLLADVCAELERAIERAVERGVERSRIWVDPGLGFAKTAAQSLELLARTGELCALGQRVLVGGSRKSFIAQVCAQESLPPPGERLGGSVAAAIAAAARGARAVRVHDVAETLQALLLMSALEDLR